MKNNQSDYDRIKTAKISITYKDELIADFASNVKVSSFIESINGKIIDNSFAYGTTSDVDKIELGEDEYFILGDNRLISKDSRYFGPVTKSEIIGKVVFRLFPFNKIGTVK